MDTAFETKKQQEWNAIHFVYSKDKYRIIPIHRPDFELTDHITNYTIGIEITSVYLHNASARLKNLDHYASEVLAEKIVKEDSKCLRTEELIVNPDNSREEKRFTAVLYNHPPVHEYLQLLENSIQQKAAKYASYPNIYNKLELIVKDEENIFSGWTIKEFSAVIFKSRVLIKAIQFNRFSEIYYVTNIDKRPVYIPLKQSLFWYRSGLITYFFNASLRAKYKFKSYTAIHISLMHSLGYPLLKIAHPSATVTTLLYDKCLMTIASAPILIRSLLLPYNEKVDKIIPIRDVDQYYSGIPHTEIFEQFQEYSFSMHALLDHFLMTEPIKKDFFIDVIH